MPRTKKTPQDAISLDNSNLNPETEPATPRRRRRTADELLADSVLAPTPVATEAPGKKTRARKPAKVEQPAPEAGTESASTPTDQPEKLVASFRSPKSRPAPRTKPEVARDEASVDAWADEGLSLSWRSRPDNAPAERPAASERPTPKDRPAKNAPEDRTARRNRLFAAREDNAPPAETTSGTKSEPKPETKPETKLESKSESKRATESAAKARPAPPTKPPIIRAGATTDFRIDDDESRLLVLEWRTGSGAPPANESSDEEFRTRRSRNRRRRDRQDIEISAAAAVPHDLESEGEAEEAHQAPSDRRGKRRRERPDRDPEAKPEPAVAASEPSAPTAPARPPVPRPEHAAQVVVKDGRPVLLRDRRIYAPLVFAADSRDARRRETVLEQVRLAAENEVELVSLTLDLPVHSDKVSGALSHAVEMVERVTAIHPQAQIIFRVHFAPENGWDRQYPQAAFEVMGLGKVGPSFADDQFWGDAEGVLTELVRGLAISPVARRVMGVHLDYQRWTQAEEVGYDQSEAAQQGFRKWLRQRYRGDLVSLRAAWFQGQATWESIRIPAAGLPEEGGQVVRTDRKARPWIDYHLFLSDIVAERLVSLCYAAKSASGGEFLVGIDYGHTLEWSHPTSGHLSLGKLLRCPDLDYLSGPASYRDRVAGGSAAFPLPIDSIHLNGKLFLSEADFRTPISGPSEADPANPVMKTPQALESVHWRGSGAVLAHRGGLVWSDTYGEGWLNSRGIWERARSISELLLKQMAVKPVAPDVAVFIDERSLSYLVDPKAFEVLVQQVRESMLRSGLNVGFYLLSDLAHRENFPDSCLYVFVNAWDIRPEVRSAIKSRLQRDGKVLFWLYTAGLFEAGRESLERVREVTGIALRPQPFASRPGTTLLNTRDPLCQHLPYDQMLKGGELDPSYFAIPEDATVLGQYTQTGLPSFVVRRLNGEGPDDHWTSVFLGEPIVTPAFFRALGQFAGAHVWSFDGDLVHAGFPFLTVHCRGTGPRTLTLPDQWNAYDVINREWLTVEGNSVRFRALDGTTQSFLVGKPGDIDAVLHADIASLRPFHDPLVRDENTLHWDSVKFDVAIMKLDEWVEETWSEDHADDLLIKPSMIENDLSEEEERESTGQPQDQKRHGRRRRRSRGDRRGNGSGGGRESEGSDIGLGINVLFRKRE